MLTVLVYGVVTFPGIFFFLRKVLSHAFRQWTDADVVFVSEKLVSSLHAILATVAGLIIVTSCNDVMTDRHWLATYFVWFGIPYMSYDICAMYLSHYYTRQVRGHKGYEAHSLHTLRAFICQDFLLVVHHTVLLTILLPITLFFRRDLGDFFIGCFFIAEFSTPFVSLGKILIQLGLQDIWLHKVNGLMVLLSFFMCRIALFPYMYWAYGQQHGIPLHRVPFHLPLCCNLGNLSVLAPQLYWFARLCRKAHRLYSRHIKPRNSPSTAGSLKLD